MLDRRRFLQGAGAVAGLGAMPAAAWAAMAEPWKAAYVAHGADWVELFRGSGEHWMRAGRIASPAASALCVAGGRLYVGNAVERFEGRPGGTVEVFALERGGARSMGRRALALFAGRPERMAVSPGGTWLAVGLADGGYNLLALERDGSVGPVTAAMRRVGRARAAMVGLRFVDEATLVSADGERATMLTVSGGGGLSFLPDGVQAPGVQDDGERGWNAGLAQAMAAAGVGERMSVAYG